MNLRPRRAGYANITATVALCVALGGGAYAASTAPKNSVTSKSVKNNSLKGTDLGADTLTGADLDEDSLGEVPRAAEADTADTAGTAGTAGGVAQNAVTGAGVADGSLSGADLGANSLGGAQVDESSLQLPAAPDEATPISRRMGPNAGFETLFEGNGIRLEAECSGATGNATYRIDALEAGILEVENQFSAQNATISTISGPASDIGSVGLGASGQAHTNYFWRRNGDGKTVTISLGATNDAAVIPVECVYTGVAAAG